MAIQVRRGSFFNFDPAKLRPGEPAAILSDDPTSQSGKALYICYSAGYVQRLATFEDMGLILQDTLHVSENESGELIVTIGGE